MDTSRDTAAQHAQHAQHALTAWPITRPDQLLYGFLGGIASVWLRLGDAGQALLALMLVDFVSGLLAAGIAGGVSSRVGAKGLLRKGLIWCVVGGVYFAQQAVPGLPAVNALMWAFCAVELVSIVENAGRAGVPLPALLTRSIQQLRDAQPKAAPVPAALETPTPKPGA